MDDKALRKDLIELLSGGQAHLTIEKSLKRLKPGNRSVRPQKGIPSIYEELEHMRLAQEDILRYMLDDTWESPSFPDGYWPSNNDVTWCRCVSMFQCCVKGVYNFPPRIT